MVANVSKSVKSGFEYAEPLVSLDLIILEGNIRPIEESHVKELAKSIKSIGLMERPTLRRVGEKYEIVSGFHRVHAMKSLKMDKIPVNLAADGQAISPEAKIVGNVVRLNMPPMEIARNIKAMVMVDGAISDNRIKEVAASIGKPVSWVKDHLKLTEGIVGEFQDLLMSRDSGFTKEHGLAVSTLEKAQQDKVYQLWKHHKGGSAEAVKSWAKNPDKSMEAAGLKPRESAPKAAANTGDKPVHHGMEMQKVMAQLVKDGKPEDLVKDSAAALIALLPEMVKAVFESGKDFDAIITAITAAVKGDAQ